MVLCNESTHQTACMCVSLLCVSLLCVSCTPDRDHCLVELAERPAVMTYYRAVPIPPPFGGEPPPRQLPGIVYSLPPKGAGTSVASQLPCEYRFPESVSWAVQPHFLLEILAPRFHHSAPRHNLENEQNYDS